MSTDPNSSPSATVQPTRPPSALAGRLTTGARGFAFWAAVALPFVVLLSLQAGLLALPGATGLVGVNALCAVLGHDYATR